MAYILNKAPILCRSAFHKNIISDPVIKITHVRNYEHVTNRTNLWAEQKYKLKDNIGNGYRLIYREQTAVNVLTSVAHHLGCIGLVACTLTTGYLIIMRPPIHEKGNENIFRPGYEIRPLSTLERAFMLFIVFAISIILIKSTKIIPFRIYHNSTEKIYKAVFVNRILSKKQIETFGEGTVVPVFGRKLLGDVLFDINGRIVLLDKECFPVPYVRDRMIRKTK